MYRVDTSARCIEIDAGGPCSSEGGTRMNRRSGVLTLAVLGLLHESPMHGYELRKRLNATLGALRAFSYGSLYPCLKSLVDRGWIVGTESAPGAAHGVGSKRARIVYQLTADGKEHFAELLDESGPSAWDDEGFGVHFAFFGRTDAATRLRILEGRRSRLEERMAGFRGALSRSRERVDSYTLALHQHGLESVEREVRWLSELIDDERRRRPSEESGAVTPDVRPTASGPANPAAPGTT
jgi:DNA-binding PadR family transcriptional regulator